MNSDRDTFFGYLMILVVCIGIAFAAGITAGEAGVVDKCKAAKQVVVDNQVFKCEATGEWGE